MPDIPKTVVKVFVELVKHQAKRQLGDGAINVLAEAVADFAGDEVSEKLAAYLDQGESAEKLLSAFERADACFAGECGDEKLRQAIHDKPLRDLGTLAKLAARLPQTLDGEGLYAALRGQFAADWPGQLSDAQIDRAGQVYRRCLERSLAVACGQLLPAVYLKVERIEGTTQRTEQNTRDLLEGQAEIKALLNEGAGDKVSGDKVNGDKVAGNKITYIIQLPAYQPPPDLEQLRDQYLEYLQRTYRALDFKGIPQLESFSRELLLEEVYVPLAARAELPTGETWERRLAGRMWQSGELPEGALAALDRGASLPAPVEQAVGEHKQVVVLGDPGSGKSTLLKHLALRLAGEGQAPLPILLPLNAYAAALEKHGDLNLQTYLAGYFAAQAQGIAGLEPLFASAIASGRALILLDGLDEVQSERPRLVHKVQAFAAEATARGNKLVVTSRIVGYRESPLDPGSWTLYTLLDFDRAAIEQFTGKWCAAFERLTLGDAPQAEANARKERDDLLAAIASNPGVARLAANPLLLTILALVKRQRVTLPNRRARLYDVYLETLISAWSKARSLDKRQIGPQMDYQEILDVLGPLALWLRRENPTAGLVSEAALLDWLTRYYMDPAWDLRRGPAAEKGRGFLKSVHTYSNLLLERGQGQYGFIHLTFEEMLAAYGLCQMGQLRLQDSLALIQEYLTDPAWRETILLAVGVWGLVIRLPLVAGEVVRAMLKMECSAADACQNVLLAGACLEDVGETGIGRGAAREVIAALLAASRDRSLPPAVQRDAGFSLGRAGWAPDDLDAFVEIPAGPFLYGEEKKKRVIKKPFAIAKYPVTNLQYRRFIEVGGYDRQQWWSAEGWAWRMGEYDSKAPKNLKDWLARRPAEKRNEPFYWRDAKWNNPLAPVVGVSWFEAEAYCNWLAVELRRPVRLPTEEEWERAARGVDGREYPWGEAFDRQRLNCAEWWGGEDDLSDWDAWQKWAESDSAKTASTTMVGQFARRDAPDEICDLSGNVWEWTASWWERDKINRVLRGGSWFLAQRFARCASRYRNAPDLYGVYLGLRVLSPGSEG